MTESQKTLSLVGAALLVLGINFALRPRNVDVARQPDTGPFFAQFDPLSASSLEILEYDEDTAQTHPFKVAQVNNIWSIPSHFNYPADAQRQLAEAATSVMDLKRLGLVTSDPAEHALYGVVDPDPNTVKAGDKGVGKRVTLADSAGKTLAHFIVGKSPKDKANLRYVRVPGQNEVFQTELNPDKLSTKFEDWIEKDLLKLNDFDIKDVVLNNYSIDELNRRIVQGDLVELTYDSDGSKWNLRDLRPGEELDTTKLNDLKTALDDLKIVDVRRKPAGLGRELKQQEGMQLEQSDMQDLMAKGYYIVQGNLMSNEGEVICKMKDGVVYVLRFGEIASNTGSRPEKKEGEADTAVKANDSNRYLFVTASFDPDMLPKPDLQPLPDVPTPPADNKPADNKPADNKPADNKPADNKPADNKPADNKPADNKPADNQPEASPPDDKKPATTQPSGGGGADGQDNQPADTADPAAAAQPAANQPADTGAASTQPSGPSRQEIEKENQRKLDEFNDKVKKGEEKVKELNGRFADWYYVISDEVYRKIHLGRSDIIKQSPAGDTTPDALDKIKQQGLTPSTTP